MFWMFVAAFFGMATKYSECLLAVKYREVDEKGRYRGGPMYYIKNGLHCKSLAALFALLTVGAGCFGIGTYCQVNSMVDANRIMFGMSPLASCAIISALVGMVTVGGLNSISRVSTKLIPLMAVFYIVGCLFVILVNIENLPSAIVLIVKSAFNFDAGVGAATGIGILVAMRFGVARGMFSNEAGLGSFRQTLGDSWGIYMVNIGLLLFAFTTVIGWNYYAESCVVYLFGTKVIYVYRFIYILIVASAAFMTLDLVWILADILNGLMALPNLIALFLLRKDIVEETKKYFAHLKELKVKI